MFTGIITACSKIQGIADHAGNSIVTIMKPQEWQLSVGESININGVCSTVIQQSTYHFSVEYMPETLRLTTMRRAKEGDGVNLERSMQLQDLVSGHLVYGHVDGMGTVDSIVQDGESYVCTFLFEPTFSKYIISKGSITVNGISLTVIEPEENRFSVAIIPHTWNQTNVQYLNDGDEVNLEFDTIAKYVEKITQAAMQR